MPMLHQQGIATAGTSVHHVFCLQGSWIEEGAVVTDIGTVDSQTMTNISMLLQLLTTAWSAGLLDQGG
jgi:hypothetical protein